LSELKEQLDVPNPNQDKIADEFGDVLFALVNLSRYIQVDPEMALDRTNRKFIRRFSYIEERALAMNRKLTDMSLEEMDALWVEAKLSE
jgi:XTP/dITP diphosphohydrolase